MDSVYSHLAWVDNIKQTFDVTIPFPIIADVRQTVAKQYGMVQGGGDTATVRTVFFIDPEGTIRALLAYPAAIGRSVDELLRVFDAFLENTVSGGCAIPADWTRGKPTVSPAPNTMDGLRLRWKSTTQPGNLAWYYQINE